MNIIYRNGCLIITGIFAFRMHKKGLIHVMNIHYCYCYYLICNSKRYHTNAYKGE